MTACSTLRPRCSLRHTRVFSVAVNKVKHNINRFHGKGNWLNWLSYRNILLLYSCVSSSLKAWSYLYSFSDCVLAWTGLLTQDRLVPLVHAAGAKIPTLPSVRLSRNQNPSHQATFFSAVQFWWVCALRHLSQNHIDLLLARICVISCTALRRHD